MLNTGECSILFVICSYHTLDEGFFFTFHYYLFFLYKFREVFLFYILQPCSGQTFSFSFELKASAVFYSLIYFDNVLDHFKEFQGYIIKFY